LLEANTCRKGHNPTGGSQSAFSICSENAAPRYAVSFLEMRDVRAKSDDSSRRLLPRNEGWLIAIAALPNVQIDEVHPAGRDMDKYFAIAGSGYSRLP
jgi:hypothetical protein